VTDSKAVLVWREGVLIGILALPKNEDGKMPSHISYKGVEFQFVAIFALPNHHEPGDDRACMCYETTAPDAILADVPIFFGRDIRSANYGFTVH